MFLLFLTRLSESIHMLAMFRTIEVGAGHRWEACMSDHVFRSVGWRWQSHRNCQTETRAMTVVFFLVSYCLAPHSLILFYTVRW